MPVLRRDDGAVQDLLSDAQRTNDPGRGRPAVAAAGPVRAYATPTFASGPMAQGATFTYTFKKPGTYCYECTIHASMPGMHAAVIVK